MKPGQIITHKGSAYQLIKKKGAVGIHGIGTTKQWWDAKHLSSGKVMEIELTREGISNEDNKG